MNKEINTLDTIIKAYSNKKINNKKKEIEFILPL